jgi:DNA-binding transcriptional LysR family regulator
MRTRFRTPGHRNGRRRQLQFDDDLGAFAILQKAVEVGSLIGSARALQMNPVVLRQKLRRLEDRLGLRLLERTTRRLSLTAAGRAYLERYRPIVAQVMAARAALTGAPVPGEAAPAPAATPVALAAPAGAAAAELPAQLDLTLRRLDDGHWAAVCFQRQLVRLGSAPDQVLAQLASDLLPR